MQFVLLFRNIAKQNPVVAFSLKKTFYIAKRLDSRLKISQPVFAIFFSHFVFDLPSAVPTYPVYIVNCTLQHIAQCLRYRQQLRYII